MVWKILRIALYFLFLFASQVRADSFDSTGDSSQNGLVSTVAYTVDQFAEIRGIEYSLSDVLGEGTQSVSSINMLLDTNYQRRIPMVADRVYGPPGTVVDVSYFYKNNTNHPIPIPKIALTLSKNSLSNDITKLIDISPTYGVLENLNIKASGNILFKTGIVKEYPGIGEIQETESGGFLLDQFEIKNPLQVDSVVLEKKSENIYSVKLWLQNNSQEYLNNIVFTHGSYTQQFDLADSEEKVLEYDIESSSENLGAYRIYNPNIKTVCAVQGTSWYNNVDIDSVPVFSFRDFKSWIPGANVQPVIESFCIGRVPYTMYSEDIIYSGQQIEESLTPEVLGAQDTSINTEDLEILPKAGERNLTLILFLVVDIVLWYAFYILRRNYESKNTNSRLCTKSCQDVR